MIVPTVRAVQQPVDNCTPEAIDAVVTTLRIEGAISPSSGDFGRHSGGAAIAGNLLGNKGIADAALLVSCPRDLVAPGLGHTILLEPVATQRFKDIVLAMGASR
jgi:hypothetical protein